MSEQLKRGDENARFYCRNTYRNVGWDICGILDERRENDMSELPLKTDAQMRGDEFVDKVVEKKLEDILYQQGRGYTTEINCVLAKEKDRKSCQCRNCSSQRRKRADLLLKDFNWTMDMLTPYKRGRQWIETFSKPRGWDIKKIVRRKKDE